MDAESDDEALEPVPPSEDCHQGKHGTCQGDSWDPVDDVPADCTCVCHPTVPRTLEQARSAW